MAPQEDSTKSGPARSDNCVVNSHKSESSGNPGRRKGEERSRPPMPGHPPPLPPPLQPFIDSPHSAAISASLPPIPTLYPQQALQLRKEADSKKSHTRSISFPAIFRKKNIADARPGLIDDSNEDSDDETVFLTTDVNGKESVTKLQPMAEQVQDQTGSCMTCGQTIKWPKLEQAIRCPRCSCIHDYSKREKGDGSKSYAEHRHLHRSTSEQQIEIVDKSRDQSRLV